MLDVALAHPEDTDWPRVAERARTTNQRSIEIVQSLLDLAELSGAGLDTEPVRLDEVALSVVAELAAEATGRGVTVRTELTPVAAAADPVLLRLALSNLLANAVRHNVEGGSIVVTSEPAPDAAARLVVTNTGDVVAPEALASLTEPFVRGAGRIAAPGAGPRGHGLGLALVVSIARALGGSLELSANAAPGGGLTATLTLPAG